MEKKLLRKIFLLTLVASFPKSSVITLIIKRLIIPFFLKNFPNINLF